MHESESKMQAANRCKLDSSRNEREIVLVMTSTSSGMCLIPELTVISLYRHRCREQQMRVASEGRRGHVSLRPEPSTAPKLDPSNSAHHIRGEICCAVCVGMNTRHISDERGHSLPIGRVFACGDVLSKLGSAKRSNTKKAKAPSHAC